MGMRLVVWVLVLNEDLMMSWPTWRRCRSSKRYSGTAYSGTLSYARTLAIAAALGTAIAATMVTAIADGDLLHRCYEGAQN